MTTKSAHVYTPIPPGAVLTHLGARQYLAKRVLTQLTQLTQKRVKARVSLYRAR